MHVSTCPSPINTASCTARLSVGLPLAGAYERREAATSCHISTAVLRVGNYMLNIASFPGPIRKKGYLMRPGNEAITKTYKQHASTKFNSHQYFQPYSASLSVAHRTHSEINSPILLARVLKLEDAIKLAHASTLYILTTQYSGTVLVLSGISLVPRPLDLQLFVAYYIVCKDFSL